MFSQDELSTMPRAVQEAYRKGFGDNSELSQQLAAARNRHEDAENRPERRELFPVGVETEPRENLLERLYKANGYSYVKSNQLK
jgi:hypothetical protein